MKMTFTLIALFSFSLLHAQKAGTLDQSFGNQGKIVYALPDNYADCYASALQADGKIIVAGEAGYGEPTGSFFLRRFNTDGTVDISFGDSGNVISYFGFTEQGIYALAVTSDNKIVAAGFCNDLGLNICMARYLPDGSLDNTFGKNGVVNSDLGGWEWARGMVLQPDGKIVITGRVTPSPIGNFMVARYTENGNLDSSFGTNGRTITDMGADEQSGCIALQKDGKIIVGGEQAPNDNTGRNELFALARYTTNGVLDESFGNNGIVLQDFTDYYDVINSIALQGDGKIIAAGQVNGSYDYIHEYMAAARFNTDGSLDESFGNNGLVEAKYKPNYPTNGASVLVQPDDKIILGGNDSYDGGDTLIQDFFTERLLPDGSVDNSYGTNGQVTTDMGAYDQIVSMLLQPDGKVVASGEILIPTDPYYTYEVGIARYNGDESKKQIIVQKIRHYIQTHNAQATTLSAVSIYPNPAQNVLHIVGLSSNSKLTVVDLNGGIALSRDLRAVSGVHDLNIASLHAGNYLLKIETNGEVVTKQFIKQ
jgi:uncharacterized delta-60 repeat protein